MKALKTNKVFFSAHRATADAVTNDMNHAKALELLHREGLNFHVVTGVWKGVSERSIMLETTNVMRHDEHMQVALDLGRLFTQDAVLEVLNDDTAVLHDTSGGSGSSVIGKFREASREDALNRDGYTYESTSNRYFVVDHA